MALVGLPDTRYSVELLLPAADALRVRALLPATRLTTFGMRVRHERRVMRVGGLSCVPGGALGVPPADERRSAFTYARGSIQGPGLTIGMVARLLEERDAGPFLDETGVTERDDRALAGAAAEMEGRAVTLAQGGVNVRWENRDIERHLIEPHHAPAS